MLSGIGKRKGLARKNAAVVIGTTGILLAAGVFLAGSEQQAAFESALAEVTKGYYEIEENESSSLSKKFAAEADKKKYRQRSRINFFLKNASMQKVLCKNCKKNIRKMKSRENCFYYWR